jgi:hypothetical protein
MPTGTETERTNQPESGRIDLGKDLSCNEPPKGGSGGK